MKPVTKVDQHHGPRTVKRTRAIRTIGEESQGVGRIASDAAFHRLDPLPLALGSANLQAGNVLGEEQGQTPKVGVAALGVRLGAIPFVLGAHIVDHVAEMVVRDLVIVVGVEKIVLGQLENDRDQNKHFADHLIKDFAVEAGDLVVVLAHNVVLGHIGKSRDVFRDVELRRG